MVDQQKSSQARRQPRDKNGRFQNKNHAAKIPNSDMLQKYAQQDDHNPTEQGNNHDKRRTQQANRTETRRTGNNSTQRRGLFRSTNSPSGNGNNTGTLRNRRREDSVYPECETGGTVSSEYVLTNGHAVTGQLINAPDKSKLPARAKAFPVIKLDKTKQNAETFRNAIAQLKVSNPYAQAVYVHDADDYVKDDLYLTEDGQAGFAIAEGDELVSVFSYKGKGAGHSIVQSAVDQGARRLDCYDIDHGLPNLYEAHGFKQIARVKFKDEAADDDWNYNFMGRPDVVAMAVTDNPPKTIPYMEYDDALAEAHKYAKSKNA